MTDNAKPEPVPFPIEVTVNGVRVTVTLMLKPGTAVTVDEQRSRPSRSYRTWKRVAVSLQKDFDVAPLTKSPAAAFRNLLLFPF